MNKQELRKILLNHIAEDMNSHRILIDALTDYIASNPGDYEEIVDIFETHVYEVQQGHTALLALVDAKL